MIESDLDLLNKYWREGCEPAFAEVVRRHVDLVFSLALRKVRSRHLAEEITQSAFLDLSRSIGRLRPDTVVSAWLYKVTHRTAVDAVRRETRRQAREQMAFNTSAIASTTDSSQTDWTQLEPVLDDEMAVLPETDRTAILLRFFEGKSFGEVGRAIGASDDAAQKRVSRALEKLRIGLHRRGVTVGATGLVAVISSQAVQAAPAGLASSIAGSVAAAAIAGGGAAAVAVKSLTVGTMQKAAVALVAAAAIGTAAYQTKRGNRLERELAEAWEHTATLARSQPGKAGAALQPGAVTRPQYDSLKEAWDRLRGERKDLIAQRDAAERLAQLYKEVATSRENAVTADQYPTSRHVTAARGRLMRKSVMMQESLKDRNPAEMSPEEQDALQSGGVAMMAEIATLAEADLQLSRREQQPKDPVDDLTVFAFGALDLDEPQFHQVYGLLRELEREAAILSAGGAAVSGEQQEALKATGEERFRALLSPEQQRLFQALKPHLPLVRFQPLK